MTLKFFLKLFKAINSNQSPNELCFGFAFGAIIGLIPGFNLLSFIIISLTYLLNVNMTLVLLATLLFKPISLLIYAITDQIGYYLLVNSNSLYDFWTFLYNLPIIPWTKFNNTLVLGSFILGLILFIPNYFFSKLILIKYRQNILTKILNSKLYKKFLTSSFYAWLNKLKIKQMYDKII